MKELNLLFAEDHDMVRSGIKFMLNKQKEFSANIDEASDGAEAIFMASNKSYDVIILDVGLPKKNGIEVARFLKKKLVDPNILMLSMHDEGFIIKDAIRAGAMGYILKNSGLQELTKAILSVYNKKKYFGEDIDEAISGSHPVKEKQTKKVNILKLKNEITERELQVLKLLVKGFTDKEIASNLNISDRTVGNHRQRLIQKFGLKNSIELAAYAVKYGLV